MVMARNLNRSKADYRKRCKYYLADYNDMKKLTRDETLQGLFYARVVSSNITSMVTGQTRRNDIMTQIETPDDIKIEVDGFIEMDGLIHRVELVDLVYIDNFRKNYLITMRREAK